MKRNILALTLPLLLCAPARGALNVLSVSDESMSPTVVMPESFETNVRDMQENWYLRNYAIIDREADSRDRGDLSEDVIIERLSKLPTVIEMPYNSVVANTIRYYVNRPQLVENMLGLSLYYMPIFDEALNRHGLPRELRYLPVIESALVPTAKSRVGAGGLWQFMPATGAGLDLEQNSLVDMRFDPYASSEAAAVYLKQLNQAFDGDWSLAIAAYNCGAGNVNKALRRAGGGKHDFWEIYPFLPRETRGYVPAFIAANYIMTYHKEHNISPALARRPIVVDTVHVNRRVHFAQISEVMDIPMDELRALNPQYRQDVIPGDIKPYPLTLPSLQAYAYIASEDSIVNHDAARYARRGVVEPSDGTVTGTDSRGEYVEEEIIQWHKVRRGETLSKIARRYGTTVSAIRRLNHCGKRVQTGQRLKIKTVVRRYKPRQTEQADNTPRREVQLAVADNVAPDSTATDSVRTTAAAPADTTAAGTVASAFAAAETTSAQTNSSNSSASSESSDRTNRSNESDNSNSSNSSNNSRRRNNSQRRRIHQVRRGESLSKIARRYGVTVAALKRANNLRSDNIHTGQRLVIPQ